jgi:hypothetical protein
MTLRHTKQALFDLVFVSTLIAGNMAAPQAKTVESSVVVDKLSAVEPILAVDTPSAV